MKKMHYKKVQRGNSGGVAWTLRTSKMDIFATIFNGFVNCCCKAFDLRCL